MRPALSCHSTGAQGHDGAAPVCIRVTCLEGARGHWVFGRWAAGPSQLSRLNCLSPILAELLRQRNSAAVGEVPLHIQQLRWLCPGRARGDLSILYSCAALSHAATSTGPSAASDLPRSVLSDTCLFIAVSGRQMDPLPLHETSLVSSRQVPSTHHGFSSTLVRFYTFLPLCALVEAFACCWSTCARHALFCRL